MNALLEVKLLDGLFYLEYDLLKCLTQRSLAIDSFIKGSFNVDQHASFLVPAQSPRVQFLTLILFVLLLTETLGVHLHFLELPKSLLLFGRHEVVFGRVGQALLPGLQFLEFVLCLLAFGTHLAGQDGVLRRVVLDQFGRVGLVLE